MKAIVQDKYGPPDVLQLGDIDKPVINDDEVLVRVHAVTTNVGQKEGNKAINRSTATTRDKGDLVSRNPLGVFEESSEAIINQ